MAVATGTATNFVDFYNKLRAFLLTNATLVAASQAWTQIAGNTGTLTIDDTITLQGPGLSGTDQVRIKLKPVYSVVNNRYNLELVGVPTWSGAANQDAQFNMSTPVYMHLWNGSIPYKFVANGRRFIVVAQITTTVEAGYCGFFLPYALPSEYPYPMCVGGTSQVSTWDYTQASFEHSHFVNPSRSLRVYTPGNTWLSMENFTQSSSQSWSQWHINTNLIGATLPYQQGNGNDGQVRSFWASIRECFGGEFPAHPIVLVTLFPSRARYGVLDGCFWVPGIGNAHGNTMTIDGVDHMVVQNVTRTDNFQGYWALKLE